jgi:hypothetical protein
MYGDAVLIFGLSFHGNPARHRHHGTRIDAQLKAAYFINRAHFQIVEYLGKILSSLELCVQ